MENDEYAIYLNSNEKRLGSNFERWKDLFNIKWRHQKEGYRIVYHMYGSSSIKRKDGGTWLSYWEEEKDCKFISFPHMKMCDCCKEYAAEFVGSHVIDKDTGEIFIYPCCKKCNDSVKGVEKDNPFYALESQLVRVREEAVYFENPDESLEELRKEALRHI